MTMKKTLGGDRLGAGKRMKVELHNYERSTHDMGYLWRSTMSAGTLVPFLCEVALPGDTFDINLDCDVKTHPTIGPLFGSFKVQLDIFHAPIRLYQGALHNNKLGIGRDMKNIKLPLIRLTALQIDDAPDINNSQINPSNILAYLGIRGVGSTTIAQGSQTRDFNAVPLLSYWDIYKNYYANKQEEIGAVIHAPNNVVLPNIVSVNIDGEDLALAPAIQNQPIKIVSNDNVTSVLQLSYTPPIDLEWLMIVTDKGTIQATEIFDIQSDAGNIITANYNGKFGTLNAYQWRYAQANEIRLAPVQVTTFPLSNIDTVREGLLLTAGSTTPKIINVDGPTNIVPYSLHNSTFAMLSSQEGLGLKTYQSDLFNNWLKTEWIDGPGGINEITSVDTSGGSFTIDTLNLSKKVYDMLNRIAVSGGSYDDWIDAVYTHDRFTRIETPVYHGGLIKELVFQEVINNSESETSDGTQALGTLAGKGVMAKKHKGGQIIVKVDEPSYIIGIISLTPRIDYSQGNRWDVNLKTLDDFHKPALDEIGFQELITEQMAWWTTNWDPTSETWGTRSAGKQPAWINYMTNINKTYGNFAIETNEMFMTLNRKYDMDQFGPNDRRIKDLTTYIDPAKYNNIFAQTSLDSQNFWVQIAVDITARRKMSAKVMPNL